MAAWQEIAFALILSIAVVGAFLRRFFPYDIYFLSAACLIGILGIVPGKVIFNCIANDAILTVIALWLIAQAMEETGLFRRISHTLVLKTKIPLLFSLGFLGAFLNHTFLLLNTIPYLPRPHRFLLPISFALLLGAACTLIGTAVALFTNQLLHWQCPDCHLTFFELGKIGFPCFIAGIAYLIFMTPSLKKEQNFFNSDAVVPLGSTWIGKKLLNASFYPKGEVEEGSLVEFHGKEPREDSQDLLFFRAKSHVSHSFSKKEKIVIGVLCLTILALILGSPLPITAIAAACLLVAFRGLPVQAIAKAMRWDILILLISSGILMAAFQQTSFPHTLAEKIFSIAGSSPTFTIGIFFVGVFILDFFIPSIVTVGLLFPIAAETTKLAGWSEMNGLAAALVLAAVVCHLRPRGVQTHALIVHCGAYRTSDYWKIGFPLVVIVLLISLFLIPRLWLFS